MTAGQWSCSSTAAPSDTTSRGDSSSGHISGSTNTESDLSTFGIDCCHMAGNYLTIEAVDGPERRGEWQRDSIRREGSRARWSWDSEAPNEAWESAFSRGRLGPQRSSSVDDNSVAFIWGCHSAPFKVSDTLWSGLDEETGSRRKKERVHTGPLGEML